ncbi:unnamed protein product [Urochloa humidicola]
MRTAAAGSDELHGDAVVLQELLCPRPPYSHNHSLVRRLMRHAYRAGSKELFDSVALARVQRGNSKTKYWRPDDKSDETGAELVDSVPGQQARRALNLSFSADACGEGPSEAGVWLKPKERRPEMMEGWSKQLLDLDLAMMIEEATTFGWKLTEVVM